ncbi:putative aminoacrylate hydrolase RutD [compost metagenome]
MLTSNAHGSSPMSALRFPLVLLPGMNCTTDIWSGCGLEGAIAPNLEERTIDRQVDALLDTLPDRFALAGLSLGAIVSMALVRKAPERVAQLCLIATNSKEPTEAQQAGWRIWKDRLAAGESAENLQAEILDILISAPAKLRDPKLADRVLRMGADTGSERLDAQLAMQGTRTDESMTLSRLNIPVLIVSGAYDVICPPQFHRDIATAIPSAELEYCKAGHLSTMERPAEVGRLLRSWLAK